MISTFFGNWCSLINVLGHVPVTPQTHRIWNCQPSSMQKPGWVTWGLQTWSTTRWTRVIATSLGRAVFSFFFLRDSPVVTVKTQTNSQPMSTFVPYISPLPQTAGIFRPYLISPWGVFSWPGPDGLPQEVWLKHPSPLSIQSPYACRHPSVLPEIVSHPLVWGGCRIFTANEISPPHFLWHPISNFTGGGIAGKTDFNAMLALCSLVSD